MRVDAGAALEAAESTPDAPVPLHLRNAPTKLVKDAGWGTGYRYVHDDPAAAQERALQRVQRPEDLVGAVIFFASADSDFITGQSLVVDGGAFMH